MRFLVRKVPDSCIEVWIVDTGAANDIVGELEALTLAFRKAKIPLVFTTANGKI